MIIKCVVLCRPHAVSAVCRVIQLIPHFGPQCIGSEGALSNKGLKEYHDMSIRILMPIFSQ